MKEPEANLPIRYAQAEHILKALSLLPQEDQKSVTHTDLVRRISIIRDAWKKAESVRKTKRNKVIHSKFTKKKT